MRASFWARLSCAICASYFLKTAIGAHAQESCANLQNQAQVLRSHGGAGDPWDTFIQQKMQQLGCFGGQQQTIAPQPPSQSRFTPPAWSPPPLPPEPRYDIANNPVTQFAAQFGQTLSRGRPLQQDIPLSSGVVKQPDPVLMQMAKEYTDPFQISPPRTPSSPTTAAPPTTPRPPVNLGNSIGTLAPPPGSGPSSTTAVPPSAQQPVNKYDVCAGSSTFGPRAPASCELGDYIYFQNGSSIKVR
jgi:hypothetical protein